MRMYPAPPRRVNPTFADKPPESRRVAQAFGPATDRSSSHSSTKRREETDLPLPPVGSGSPLELGREARQIPHRLQRFLEDLPVLVDDRLVPKRLLEHGAAGSDPRASATDTGADSVIRETSVRSSSVRLSGMPSSTQR